MRRVLTLVAPAVSVVALAACSSATDSATDPADLGYAAFDVCTQFVEDRLVSPGTAEFPNEFEDDGEVIMRNTAGDDWQVASHVDSQNGFGAVVRNEFTCDVRHVDGDQWRLVNLDLAER